ncbi:hypothetical protein M1D93_05565 [Arthrobacter sp. Z1-9]
MLSASELAETARRRNDVRNDESGDDAEDSDRSEDVDGDSDAALSDAQQARAADVFQYLEERERVFGTSYPFYLDERRRLRLAEESHSRSIYLFLLHCSVLRYVPSLLTRTQLTARFEALSMQVLKEVMPLSAQVHLFGKNAELSDDRYAGKLSHKLDLLVKDLGEEARFDKDDFGPKDFGDNGLDLVAWVPMGDALNGRPVVFGQCACTPQWVVKQHSSSGAAFNMVMSQIVEPINMCFIPFDFRRADGTWYKRPSIQRSVPVDRRRLMTLLGVLTDGHANEDLAAKWAERLDFPSLNESRRMAAAELLEN